MLRRRHGRETPPGPAGAAPPRIGSAVARFVAGSAVAVAVVVVAGYFALRSVTISEAQRNTRQLVALQGDLVATALENGILKGKAASRAKIDDLVNAKVLPPSSGTGAPADSDTPPIVRVKLWGPNGKILYSDVKELEGAKYKLGADEKEILEDGGSEAEISDLTKPENRYERQFGKLLEAYTRVRTPDGTPVLFEIYQRFSAVSASAARLRSTLALPLIAGLVVLLLSVVPLAYSMARRLQKGHEEREALLANAIEASAQERRRIASDLHDGVVQDVAGVAFGLAPLAEEARTRGDEDEYQALRGSMATLRQGVRDLRTLLVEIHPPSLESTGLQAALHDLMSPLNADGIATDLHVDDAATAASNGDALVYRVAREALRNVQKHSEAESVRIDVTRPTPGVTRLVVTDDGKGIPEGKREQRREEGHVGLTLLESLVKQSNGTLEVRSAGPGKGTTVELEVPAW